MAYIVAIDGPAGSGKGTVTELVAKKLGLVNIGSGSAYRCVALETINKGIDLKGSITHIEEYNPYMYSYEDNIQRIIYIGDTIYTLSNNKVVATNLNTMKKISELDL